MIKNIFRKNNLNKTIKFIELLSTRQKLFFILLLLCKLSIEDLKELKWENITIIKNILVLNYENYTKIKIAPNILIKYLANEDKSSDFIFPKLKFVETDLLKSEIDIKIKNSNKIKDKNLKIRIKDITMVPLRSRKVFKKYILGKTIILDGIELKNSNFKKLLKIKIRI